MCVASHIDITGIEKTDGLHKTINTRSAIQYYQSNTKRTTRSTEKSYLEKLESTI